MLLEPLVSTIETIKARIANHGTALRENETRTRMALIDPLLQALGWDTSDPLSVLPEFDVSGRKADYALLENSGNPAATLEAKKLGEPLSSHRMQMLNYSNASGVEYAGLTDGDKWELYEVFKRGQLEDRRVLDISIADSPAHESALKLLLWQPNLASGQSVAASAPAFLSSLGQHLSESADTSIPRYAASQSPSSAIPAVSASLPQKEIEPGWRPLTELIPKSGDAPPVRLRFVDGSERQMRRAWAALVESTAEWLWRNNLLDSTKVPVQSSKWRNIVNTQPLHPEGNEFKQPAQIEGTPLWVERNISGQVAAANSKRLLELCGVSQDSVFVWFE